jgi:HEAT repeat protein
MKSLADESSEVRVQAAMALEQLAPPDALEPLKAAMHDDDPWVRSAAVQSLSAQPGARPEMFREMLGEEDLMITTSVVDALGSMASRDVDEAMEILEEVYRDSSLEIRRSICRALSGVASEAAFDLLLKALKDEDPSIRSFAAHALAGRDEAGIRSILEELMETDSDPMVRTSIRSMLEGRG